MKITYIYHSSFLVELDTCVLLFDYFKGNIPAFDKNKKLYVFASHFHQDHFNKCIFDLEKTYPNIVYILSDDIKAKSSKNRFLIKPNNNLLIDNLEIETLLSSDIGVAFIVKVENKVIYHAGDLNWWHWEGENSEKENLEAKNMFTSSLDKIKGMNIDVAFLPLDSRQGEQYYLGFDYFMKNTNTKIAFPMHLWDKYSLINEFINSDYALSYKDKIITINQEDESFEL